MAVPTKNNLHRLKVNLLFPQGSPSKIYVKFIKWLLSYGRFIVMGVELMVIGAFVFRFQLDAKLSDLNTQIARQVPFIQNLQADEALVRRAQFKLETIKASLSQTPQWSFLLGKITSQLPPTIILNSFNLDSKDNIWEFRITGGAQANKDLALLLSGLRKDDSLHDVTLASLGFDTGNISFTITGNFGTSSKEATSSK